MISFDKIPVKLKVEWTDGVLAGDLAPLIDFITSKNDPIIIARWTGRRTDEPSELLSKYKII